MQAGGYGEASSRVARDAGGVWQASAQWQPNVSDGGAQNLCNMIWGMARLAEHPGETLMAFYRQCQDRMLHDRLRSKADTEQALTNTLWAMAVLDELEPNVAAEVSSLLVLMSPLMSAFLLPDVGHLEQHELSLIRHILRLMLLLTLQHIVCLTPLLREESAFFAPLHGTSGSL